MNTLIQTMREKYIEKGWRLHTIHFDTSVGFGNCSNKDNKNNGNNHVVLLVFRFFLCVCVTIIFTWLIIVIHTDRRQTTLGVEHKTSKNNHSCCLLAISVENYFIWRSQLSIFNVAFTYQITLLILRYILSESPDVIHIITSWFINGKIMSEIYITLLSV